MSPEHRFANGSGMTVDHDCCLQPVRGVYIFQVLPKLCSLLVALYALITLQLCQYNSCQEDFGLQS